ncbi:MAG: pyrrolo-quinoline quinone [Acidobacteria bacterium]|nr:MAG: pyrrolo-quinoline quinone [Acidobacteriota bacterium]
MKALRRRQTMHFSRVLHDGRERILCTVRGGPALLLLVLAWALTAVAQPSVLTWHNDNSRTGQNRAERTLTPANVNTQGFGKLFSYPVDGQIYAQPLYVPHLTIPGKGSHNVVFVATEGDSVFAFDADNNGGANAKPLWKASLIDTAHGAASGATTVDSLADTGCSDLVPKIGITSTPTIDAGTGTMYVEAKSKENGTFVHRLHALDIHTGAEKAFGPVVVTATVPGSGDGSVNGQLTFDALHHNNRPGLLLSSGTIYIAYASHCDFFPYHGWMFAYDATNLAQKAVYVTTPDGGLGGFWMSGAAPAADNEGNVFAVTGNGTFDTQNIPATELGDSILKLRLRDSEVSLLDYFTPFNQDLLNIVDGDLGSGGAMLLPDQPGSHPHLLVQAGKEGRIYLIDRDRMTAGNLHYCVMFCDGVDPQIVQEVQFAMGLVWSSAAYWNHHVYFWAIDDVLRSFSLQNGKLSRRATSSSTDVYGFPGATVSISANGNQDGIVWSLETDAFFTHGPAILKAHDASNVARKLYSSDENSSRDFPGGAVKFTMPTVVNGKVYVGAAGRLSVYGLLNQ